MIYINVIYLIYIIFLMASEKERFTTIRISANTFEKLFIVKHKLELKNKKDYSYDAVIKTLLNEVD